MKSYPAVFEVPVLERVPRLDVSVPGSKSITNRALLVAAWASRSGPCRLTGALRSEDTEVMLDCLEKLGFKSKTDWRTASITIEKNLSARIVPAETAELFVANSGTTVRFLAAGLSLAEGTYRLDGIPRMRERPILDLLEALNSIGVSAESEMGSGCPPIRIVSKGWPATGPNRLAVKAGTSSQFLSGMMMAAAFAPTETILEAAGELVSEPYLAMTVEMLRAWGVSIGVENGRTFRIPGDPHRANLAEYAIEPDASAASYFFAAAAISGGSISVRGMKPGMLQGDVAFVEVLQKMGCEVAMTTEGLRVTGGKMRGGEFDLNAISDTVMSLAAVACFAEGPTTIRNVAHIRHKETDRLHALAVELRKLGAAVREFPDGLHIVPGQLKGCEVETYNDHRMAMSLALIGLKVPGVKILNPGCVAKTYPDFWEDMAQLN